MEDSGNGIPPTSTSPSCGLVLVTKVTHVCGKFLLFDTRYRAVLYCSIAFVGSLITDFVPMPQWHFSKKDTFLNRQFAQMPQVWIPATMILWIAPTAYTLNCGRIIPVAKHLVVRPFIAIAILYLFWGIYHFTIYVYVGRCLNTTDPLLQTRTTCSKAGMSWSGLHISGHISSMIYNSLTLAAEGSAFVGWDRITDLIVREENTRNKSIMVKLSSRPLENLSTSDLAFLKKTHRLVTPYVRVLFICMTLEQACCDFVMILTVSYYHDMVEKVLGAFGGILVWYVNYYCLTKLPAMSLPAPSEGLFKYNAEFNNKLSPDTSSSEI